MIKDYFLDAFLQISIILSFMKSDYDDLRIYNQLNTLRDSLDGQLAVSPIIDVHNFNGRNPDIGFVHPKNARVEDVLRSVHSLARYEGFRGISSDVVNAFLVDEIPNVGYSTAHGNGGNTASWLSSSDNSLSRSNTPLGDEPTKEDMDLIDVLWRYDIDLNVNIEPHLRWELEKEQEVNLHKRLEEEAIALVEKQENPSLHPISLTTHLDTHTTQTTTTPIDGGECSTSRQELNTPEILVNSEFSLFSDQVMAEENIESNWTNLMNMLGVENNNSSNSVEGEMFTNLFAYNNNIDTNIYNNNNDDYYESNDDIITTNNNNYERDNNNSVKMEETRTPPFFPEDDFRPPFEDDDFQMYDDSLLDGGMELFEELGDLSNMDSFRGMEELNMDFEDLPDLALEDGGFDDDDDLSSVVNGLTGGQYTPSSSYSTSATDPSYQDLFSRDELAVTPSESSKRSPPSDRVSSRCSFSSDSLLTGCARSPRVWADTGDIRHNHTYEARSNGSFLSSPSLLLQQLPPSRRSFLLKEEEEDDEEYEDKIVAKFLAKKNFPRVSKSTRCKDDLKLKELKVPFSLDEIINNPIEWFTDIISSPKCSLNHQQIDLMRAIRKRGKNKEAAQNCRKRKLDELQSIEIEVKDLSDYWSDLQKGRGHLENSVDKLTRKFAKLQERILMSARKNNPNIVSNDVSLSFDRNGVIMLVDGPSQSQHQQEEWDPMTNTPGNPNRKATKTKRKQPKRN